MKDNRILIICHLTNSECNGQVAKTKDVIEFLKKNGYKVFILNYGQMGLLKKFLLSKRIIKKYQKIILMPGGKNALFYYSYLMLKLKKTDAHYIAIGGWVQNLLKNNKYSRKIRLLKIFKCIYLQNRETMSVFCEKGFNNLCFVSSFSSKQFLTKREFNEKQQLYNNVQEYKFCFFARVERTKGVLLACNAITKIKQNNPNIKIGLDIYGECKDKLLRDELKEIESQNPFISIKGVITGNNAIRTLSNYYCMLFPTFYKGEGTPHTIIESFGAALPVIASDWAYNSEIITNKKTGLIFSLEKENDLINKIMWSINNPEKIRAMSKNCYLESDKYNVNVLLRPLLEKLEN